MKHIPPRFLCGSAVVLTLLSFPGRCLLAASPAGRVLRVTQGDSLSIVREKLSADLDLQEVVFGKGVYFGGLYVEGKPGTVFAQRPLLIRAEEGAEVIFDGSKRVESFQPEQSLPGVFWIEYDHTGGEVPKMWEPGTRTRYSLAADREAVAWFPASYCIEGKRLLFHTSDGQAPRVGELLMSSHDSGLFVNRPFVTIRGIAFGNFLARENALKNPALWTPAR